MTEKEIVANLRAMRKSFCPIIVTETAMCGALLAEKAADLIESQEKKIKILSDKVVELMPEQDKAILESLMMYLSIGIDA